MAGEILIWSGLLLVWLWLALMQCSSANEMTQWRKVLMEPTWFTSSLRQSSLVLSKTHCGVECSQKDWCSVWCHDGNDGCKLTNMLVSGAYQPSVPDNTNICYTNSSVPEYAFNAAITSSPEYDTTRLKGYMVDGVFARTGLEASALASYDKPWYLLDLRHEVKVTKVTIYPLGSIYSTSYTRYLEVRT